MYQIGRVILNHNILQIVLVPPRASSRRIQLRGIFRGATVVRSSLHWKWEDQDGGKGSPGSVVDVEGYEGNTARSIVKVCWVANGDTQLYR